MKIAIISDTHDNLENLKRVLEKIKKERVNIILHCGDVASKETLKFLFQNFKGRVYLVLGNMDKDYELDKENLEEFSQLEFSSDIKEIEIENKKIAFCHRPEIAQNLAKSQKYDYVFYGHTHKPWMENIGQTKLINPGNVAGLFYRPSFAVCDLKTGKTELKIL